MSDRQIRCTALVLALSATLTGFQAVSALAAPAHADPRLAQLLAPAPLLLQTASAVR